MKSNKTGMRRRGEKIEREREREEEKEEEIKLKSLEDSWKECKLKQRAHNEGKLGFCVLPLRQSNMNE